MLNTFIHLSLAPLCILQSGVSFYNRLRNFFSISGNDKSHPVGRP